MKYNFENILDKRNLGSVKWKAIENIKEDIIPFSVADMEFEIASEIKNALNEVMIKNHLGYTMPDDEYFDCVISWFLKRHKFEIKKEWIIPVPGIVFALYLAVKTYTKKDDNILIMTPVYHPFYTAILSGKRKILKNPLLYKNGTYEIDFDDLAKKAKKAKALILCSPHNPVGRVWSKDELRKVGEICQKNDVLVLSDEIHSDIIMSGHKHTIFGSLSANFMNNCVIFTAPSKSFNIAGLQGSNLIIKNKKLRDKFRKELINLGIYSLNVFSYTATKIAYGKCEKWLDEVLQVIEENRGFVSKFVKKELPMIKICDMQGTYLLWMDFRNLGLNQKDLNKFLEQKAFIFANSGDVFGKDGNGFIRLNIACPKSELEKAMNRLKKAIEKDEFIK